MTKVEKADCPKDRLQINSNPNPNPDPNLNRKSFYADEYKVVSSAFSTFGLFTATSN